MSNAPPSPHPPRCRLLLPDDAPAYCTLRAQGLLDAPWAFARSPQDDPARDSSHVARMLREPIGEGGYAIAGVWYEGGGGLELVSVAGVMRTRALKMAHRATVWGVFTSAPHRGRGHARAAVSLAVQTAWDWPGVPSPFGPPWPPVSLVTLSVSERSPGALSLYRSLGFEVWGREPDYVRTDPATPGAAELHMLKPR